MQKKLAVLLLIAVTLTVLTISPLARAADYTLSQHWGTTRTPFTANPTAFGTNTVAGYSWGVKVVGDGNNLKTLTMPLGWYNSIGSGVLQGQLYSDIDHTWLQNSTDTYNIALLPGNDFVNVTLNFDGSQALSDGVIYDVVFTAKQDFTNPTGTIVVAETSGTGGTWATYKTAEWHTMAGQTEYSVTVDDATPTPTPPAGTPPTGSDLWSGTWIENVIAIILPLALILIPAFIGWKFAKAWGFFAGLNVGVILCYVYGQMIPLWGVVVMLVVDGLMLFGKLGMHD